MNIQSTRNFPSKPAVRPAVAGESATFAPNLGQNKVIDFVQQQPFRALTDVFDLGVGVPVALGADLGSGGTLEVLAGVGAVVQGTAALVEGAAALHSLDRGDKAQARHFGLRAAGDALTAAGLGMAAAGVGPVSLGFIAVGTLTATLA